MAVGGIPVVIQGVPFAVRAVRFASGSVRAAFGRVLERPRSVLFGGFPARCTLAPFLPPREDPPCEPVDK